jgi:hypothetical protein
MKSIIVTSISIFPRPLSRWSASALPKQIDIRPQNVNEPKMLQIFLVYKCTSRLLQHSKMVCHLESYTPELSHDGWVLREQRKVQQAYCQGSAIVTATATAAVWRMVNAAKAPGPTAEIRVGLTDWSEPIWLAELGAVKLQLVSCADDWSVQLLWDACVDSWSVRLLDDPVASHAGT